MDADAPAPADDLRTLREHRAVLCRRLAYTQQALRLAEAEVARLREALKAKEGATDGR